MQGEVDGSNPAAAIMGPLGPALTGLQAGSFVGVMSRQAMGQFDLAIPPLDADRAYLIVPNVEAFAAGHGLDAKQVRLWATMHELVHHAATARETVRGHFDSLVARLLEALDFDPSHLMEKLGDLQDRANLENLISEGEGLAALLGGGEAPSAAGELQAAAAFLEGYGDFAVRRAAGPILPGLEAIESAHRAVRVGASEASDQLRQLLAIELDRSLAASASKFCTQVERRWGADALDRIWEDADHMPTRGELADPVGWAARVLLG